MLPNNLDPRKVRVASTSVSYNLHPPQIFNNRTVELLLTMNFLAFKSYIFYTNKQALSIVNEPYSCWPMRHESEPNED